MSASFCFRSKWINSSDFVEHNNAGLMNFDNVLAYLACPVFDDDSLRKEYIGALNLHGYMYNQERVTAKACVTYWASNGGACGVASQTSGQGGTNYTLSPARTYWTSTWRWDFPWISVELPPGSTLRGYYAAD
jgi:hypothetical protein